MRTNVIALLRFIHGLRSDFFEAAATLGWKEFARDRAVSLGSCRNLFLHLAYVEEHHITQFCEGKPTPWPSFARQVSTRSYRDFASVRSRLEKVTALAEDRFRIWNTSRELARSVTWVRMGHPIPVTRDTALTQCTTEHLLHLGEVEALLWQRGVEPPTTLWIDREVLHGKPPAPPPVPVMRRVERERRSRASRSA